VIEKIPIKGKTDFVIVKFFSSLVETLVSEDAIPGACKMDYSLYAMHGIQGYRALKKVMGVCNKHKIPTILEAYRTDPDTAAFAREAFSFYNATATTILPYFGEASVHAILKYCEKGNGVYVINKLGHQKDFQWTKQNDTPMHMKISQKIVDWHTPGVGSLFEGRAEDIKEINRFFIHSKKDVPLLMPTGISSSQSLISALAQEDKDMAIHRVIDSTIPYAYINERTEDYYGAAAKELKRQNRGIKEIIQNKQA